MKHFDEMTVLLYLEGQLDEERAQEVPAHAASCAECRGLLQALEREEHWLREALTEEEGPVPARLLEARSRGAAPWGWIATLAFGAGGAYTLWSGFIEPWRAQAAQAGFTQGNLLTMLFFSGAFWKGWSAMRNLTEFLAVATLGAVVMWLLRRHWRRLTAIAVVMGAFLCVLALASPASAAEVKHGDPNYTLPAGQEVKTDLIVSANHTRIDGDVDGDLIVFSESVTVNGHVKGDIIAFAREIRVNGPVDGNVRTFCHSLTLTGPVARNVMTFSQEANLDQKAKVGGSMTSVAADAELDGQVTGDILAFVDRLEINGSLGRDASIRSSRVTIGPEAEIKGHMKYEGPRHPEVSPGAKLGSPIEFVIHQHRPHYASPAYYWHQILAWGASFLFGLVLVLLVPEFIFDAGNACKKFGPAIGLGLLFLIATPVAAIIACITIVGLSVGFSTLFLWLIVLYSAQVYVGSWLGERLLGVGTGIGAALGRLALGLAIIHAIELLPYLGGWVMFLVIIWGLGAVVMTAYKRIRPQLAAA
jgi:cytoskeletal protein CcmA (bactofilin family)/anti-sigma factor RsiW